MISVIYMLMVIIASIVLFLCTVATVAMLLNINRRANVIKLLKKAQREFEEYDRS